MNTHDWKQLISAYYDGALTDDELRQAETMLAERAECREYLQELKKLSVSLKLVDDQTLSPDAQMKMMNHFTKERPMRAINVKKMSAVLTTVLVLALVLQQYIHRGVQGRFKSTTDKIGMDLSASRTELKGNLHQDASAVSQKKLTMNEAGGVKISFINGMQPMAATAGGALFSSYEQIYPGRSLIAPVDGNTEEYSKITDNRFLTVHDNPLSTFSIDVDTASYSNVRRYLLQNQMPPKDAVRIEEMINYFAYNYPAPQGNDPFSITTNLAVCPWNKAHQLLQIGLKGKTPATSNLPLSNLVFLVDVSGSMDSPDKLPLLKEGFRLLVNQLRPEDKVSIVVYAGNAGKVLDPTPGDHKQTILSAIDAMQAGGSTAGGEGIRLAYELAKANFIKGGNNRVILATDGDFNVGVSSSSELVRLVEEKRKDGIFLSVLGFGQGNVKDSRMEQLADNGNGTYAYIDNIKEAHKVMVHELGSMLFTIAKDVKIQIEFNPSSVQAYRLVGYENRILAKEDFKDDQKDAGDIGAGHTVTALYEIVPAGSTEKVSDVDPLKYQKTQPISSEEVMTIKLRYKEPTQDVSQELSRVLQKAQIKDEPQGDFAWAASVAEFGMLLRDSEYKANASYGHVLKTAKANMGDDQFGLRAEFITLAEAAAAIATSQSGQLQFK